MTCRHELLLIPNTIVIHAISPIIKVHYFSKAVYSYSWYWAQNASTKWWYWERHDSSIFQKFWQLPESCYTTFKDKVSIPTEKRN